LASRIGNAMLRLGRVAEARALIGEYITKKRREQAAPSAFLKPLLIKLNLR